MSVKGFKLSDGTVEQYDYNYLANKPSDSGSGLTDSIKIALLNCFENVAWINEDGQDYYDALVEALYPIIGLDSITCVYTQSGTVYDTDSLDSLKTGLVVTAHYEDTTTETIANYQLSGTLSTGTSTITVSYGGKTDTFTVTVTHNSKQLIHDWDFTSSWTDSVGGITATATSNDTGKAPTRTSEGLVFSEYTGCVDLGAVYDLDQTIEIYFDSLNIKYTSSTGHTKVLMYGNATNTGTGLFIFRAQISVWTSYQNSTWGTSLNSNYTTRNAFNQETPFVLKFVIESDGTTTIYKDSTLIGTLNLKAPAKDSTNSNIYIGCATTTSNGGTFADATITGIKIYKEVEEESE